MHCNQCGQRITEDAVFCSKCGAQQKRDASAAPTRQPQWEYKSITIPFNVVLAKNEYVASYAQQREIERMITDRLQQEGAEGWQAEGPTDYRSVIIDYEDKRGMFNLTRHLKSATIRLRRLSF